MGGGVNANRLVFTLRHDLDHACPHELLTAAGRHLESEDIFPRIHLGDSDFDRSEPGTDFGRAAFAPLELKGCLLAAAEAQLAPDPSEETPLFLTKAQLEGDVLLPPAEAEDLPSQSKLAGRF